jgi:sulfite reductase alpha subunit-like flavoprotein
MLPRALPLKSLLPDNFDEPLDELLPKKSPYSYSIRPGTDKSEQSLSPINFDRCRILGKSRLTGQLAPKSVYSFTLSGVAHDQYMPGDSFDLVCENDGATVDWLLGRLGMHGVMDVSVAPPLVSAVYGPFDHADTRELLTKCLDLNAYPKKAFLRHLAEHCTDGQERKTLLYLASRTGSSCYLSLANQYANICDFLATFPSCMPPLECLLTFLTPLSPRAYSVCSTPLAAGPLEFWMSIDSYALPDGGERKGVCSTFLANKRPGDMLCIQRRPLTGFRLPEQGSPLIMICAGVAVSPFVGFLRHAALQGHSLAGSLLYYGLRSEDYDFLCRDELLGLAATTQVQLRTAQSRHPTNAKYVQGLLVEDCVAVCHTMLQRDGLTYLCGDELTMIKGVNEALPVMLQCGASLSEDDSKTVIKEWTRSKRIIRDIWL